MAFQIGDKYYHEDIESGEIVEISKACYDEIMAFRKRIAGMINIGNKPKGTIQVFSTMSNAEDVIDFGKMWNDLQ